MGNLRWERGNQQYNEFDQVISSEGSCVSDNMTWYLSSLVFVNGIALLLACYEAYRGRNTTAALNESKYVGMAMICIFQSCFFGVPLIIISSSNRSSLLFVVSSICFVICIATLLFIFLPKIMKQRDRDSTSAPNTVVSGLSDDAQRLRQTMRLTNTSLISQRSGLSELNRESALTSRASTNSHMRSANFTGRDAFPLRDSVLPSESRQMHPLNRSIPFGSRGSRRAEPDRGSITSLAVLADNETNDNGDELHGMSDLSMDSALSEKLTKGARRPSRYSHNNTIASISEIEQSVDVDNPIVSSGDSTFQRSSISSLGHKSSLTASVIGTVTEECTISGDEEDEELRPFVSQRTNETATSSAPSASADPIHADDKNEDKEEEFMLEQSDSFKRHAENVENLARRETNIFVDGENGADEVKTEGLNLDHHQNNVEEDIENHEDRSTESDDEANDDETMHQLV